MHILTINFNFKLKNCGSNILQCLHAGKAMDTTHVGNTTD